MNDNETQHSSGTISITKSFPILGFFISHLLGTFARSPPQKNVGFPASTQPTNKTRITILLLKHQHIKIGKKMSLFNQLGNFFSNVGEQATYFNLKVKINLLEQQSKN